MLRDGRFENALFVSTETPDMTEVAIFRDGVMVIYTRWADDAVWVKSAKTGWDGASAWVITGEVTPDDPMYTTLNDLVATAITVTAGSGVESARSRRGEDSEGRSEGASDNQLGEPAVAGNPSVVGR